MSFRLVGIIENCGRNGNPPLPPGMTTHAKLVLYELALAVPSKSSQAVCSLSIELLAERTFMCARSVKRALRILESAGLLTTRRRHWAPNEFRLHLESLRSDCGSLMDNQEAPQEVTVSHTISDPEVPRTVTVMSPFPRVPGKKPGRESALPSDSASPKAKQPRSKPSPSEPKAKRSRMVLPSIEECRAYAVEIGQPPSDGEAFWRLKDENGWRNGSQPVRDWRKTMQRYKLQGFLASQKQHGRNGSQPGRAAPTSVEELMRRADALRRPSSHS